MKHLLLLHYIMKKIIIWMVKFYKNSFNPLMPNMCRYTPSCSAYMVQAVSKRGFAVGTAMGIGRILRCNPFSLGGYNPVKENYKGKARWLL